MSRQAHRTQSVRNCPKTRSAGLVAAKFGERKAHEFRPTFIDFFMNRYG
jgi:hypothetical protein